MVQFLIIFAGGGQKICDMFGKLTEEKFTLFHHCLMDLLHQTCCLLSSRFGKYQIKFNKRLQFIHLNAIQGKRFPFPGCALAVVK